jgi:phosphoglycerate dehydrogenase-like enzyme
MLQEHADVDVKTGLNPAQLKAIIPDYEAIIVRSATQVTAEVIEHGRRLQIIGRAGAGLDNIDVVAAQERGIQVVNCPDANTLAVAEHTMGLLLALARRLPRADLSLKEGKWEKKTFMGTGLAGKTLGIVGFGRIGREVALRAQAFGMKILVNQRRPTPELNLAGATAVDLNDLLQKADFVTLHVPLKPETRHLIGAEQLALMKPAAYLINTARGGVIDEAALLKALNEGQIAGAALDVFAQEPVTDNVLARHERVIATPHIAASTEDAQQQAAVMVAEKMIDFLARVDVENVLPLRVVSLDHVFPHENVDPRRLEQLAQRLAADGYLANPPIVTQVDDHYLVLDGATRVAALQQLGYRHTVVQIITPEEGLDLHTWFHILRQIEENRLVELLGALSAVSLSEIEAGKAQEEMFEYGGLCYIRTVAGRVFLLLPAAGVSRSDALNQLTAAYIAASHVSRTPESDLIALQYQYPDMTALVVFPEFTVSQVLQAAQSGRRFPAGITRFVIPGRVLRLNADLAVLKADVPLREKNQWLHELLEEKHNKAKIRYYAEPVYLLDE